MASQSFLKGLQKGIEAGFQNTGKKTTSEVAEIDKELSSVIKIVNSLKPAKGETPSKEYVVAKRRQLEIINKRMPGLYTNLKTEQEVKDDYDSGFQKDDPTTKVDESNISVSGVSSQIAQMNRDKDVKILEAVARKNQAISKAKTEIERRLPFKQEADRMLKANLKDKDIINKTYRSILNASVDKGSLLSGDIISKNKVTDFLKVETQKGNLLQGNAQKLLVYNDVRYDEATDSFVSDTLEGSLGEAKNKYKNVTGIDVSTISGETDFDSLNTNETFYKNMYLNQGVDISQIPQDKEFILSDGEAVKYSPAEFDEKDLEIIRQYSNNLSSDVIRLDYERKISQLELNLDEYLRNIYTKGQ